MRIAASCVALAVVSFIARADTLVIYPVADNTLIEDPAGAWSLGAAGQFYAGRVGENGGNSKRRGVVRFDPAASLPAGATVTAVTLRLNCSATQAGTFTVSLHRGLDSWGEGTSSAFGGGGAPSTPNDATWIHRFYPDVLWDAPGGEFVATASASKSIGAVGFYTWGTTPGMVADVQAWIDQPATNFGWTVIGNEVTLQSVKRFDTRESPSTKPVLTITYTPAPDVLGDLTGDGHVDGADLGILLSAWGLTHPGADLDDDGDVDGTDLAVLFAHWG